ncbi:MAG: hypothetical protein FWD78_04120 [Treponema sp.]|nr:hypothetical protein [Treponema sp.]
MNKQENYRDNIYLLLGRIKLIRDTLTLDMDPEIFFTKSIDDIEFIDQILGLLLKKLREKSQLIDREELFNNLSDLEWQFSRVLSDILSGAGSISAVKNPEIKEKILLLRKNSLERRETAEAIGETTTENPKEPVLSTDELNELLKEF